MVPEIPRQPCSRSIDLLHVGDQKYALSDVFGMATMPFTATGAQEAINAARDLAGVVPLIAVDPLGSSRDPWLDELPLALEEPYIARIPTGIEFGSVVEATGASMMRR